MPSRVIRGEINASRSLTRVSRDADLTFRCLLVAVDDYGRCESDPPMLKAALFPRREDVTPVMVAQWVAELVTEGCVLAYDVQDVGYLQLTGHEQHRSNGRRAAKSRFPAPPEHLPPLPRKSEETPGHPTQVSEIRPSVVCRVASDVCREDARASEEIHTRPAARKKPETKPPESVGIGFDPVLLDQAAKAFPALFARDPWCAVVSLVWKGAKGGAPPVSKLEPLDGLKTDGVRLERVVRGLRKYLADTTRMHGIADFVAHVNDWAPPDTPATMPLPPPPPRTLQIAERERQRQREREAQHG